MGGFYFCFILVLSVLQFFQNEPAFSSNKKQMLGFFREGGMRGCLLVLGLLVLVWGFQGGLGFCSAGDQTQGPGHVRQVLFH
jgi:hypothetical protein